MTATDSPTLGRDFITAGSAIFTVEMPAAFTQAHDCPPHYTYRVNKVESDGRGAIYFASLLTGSDNENDYSYVGVLDTAYARVRLTKASRYTEESLPVQVLRRVIARLWAGQGDAIEAAGWRVHHEGKCARCSRKLTTPESVARGIGPDCWEAMGGDF